MKGMDIWCHEKTPVEQARIDFARAKTDGIEFIIPRDGWGTSKTDKMFVEYTKNSIINGIAIPGVFHFIYAVNLEEVIANAQKAIENVRKAGLPKSTTIWCDIEYDTVKDAKERGVVLTPGMQREFAEAFCNYCLIEGYTTGIYANRDYIENVYGKDILEHYDLWLADLTGDPDYPCVYRQYDWHGRPQGCPEEVDLDEYVGQYSAGTARVKGSDNLKASTLLPQIHDVVDNIPTVYEQGSQWGAWNGSAYRLDCIIFIKCMVYWGWYYPSKTAEHGGAKYNPNYDWTEIAILNHCSNVSYKNFLSAKPCSYLYMDGHGGFKIDEFTRNDKVYNVAECTWASAWGTPAKCVYSYVDNDGGRYSYKGGIRNGSWTAYGQLYGVEYDIDNNTVKKSTEEIAKEVIAGLWGNGQDRKNRLAAAGYDYAVIQAKVEELLKKPAPVKETSLSLDRFIGLLPDITKGSTGDSVKLLQNCLTILGYYTDAVDGSAGANTDKAIKAYQTDVGLYPDGIFGRKSWAKLLSQP